MLAISDKATHDIIESIYECAFSGDPSGWDRIYRSLSQALNSGPGGLSFHFEDSDEFSILASTYDESDINDFYEYFQYISPFRKPITKMSAGERFNIAGFLSDSEYENTEIYQDHHRKMGFYEMTHIALVAKGGITSGITLTRPKNRRDFTNEEEVFLSTVIPHLRRGFSSYSKLREYSLSNQLMSEALGRISHGVIALDSRGKVAFMNPSAEKALAQGDVLKLKNGSIAAVDQVESIRLKTLIKSMFNTNQNLPNAGDSTLRLGEFLDRRPIEVTITAITGENSLFNSNDRLALISIHDPDRTVAASGSRLGELYGLTAAEARIASLLAEGLTVKQICERVCVSNNTARTHVKRIFSKTSTNRQSELVKLILNGSSVSAIVTT